ncbi:MAG: hypothetical protein KJ950_08015 [Proteobacteria bacterium]|nr:hypothetical protein [Pseudomonadota bacterium]MBU1686437.1 hypothetical protein [Pseudomonadota bacterium]
MASTELPKPEGEKFKKAVLWISETLKEQPEKERDKVIKAAEIRFDLSPAEADFLERKIL